MSLEEEREEHRTARKRRVEKERREETREGEKEEKGEEKGESSCLSQNWTGRILVSMSIYTGHSHTPSQDLRYMVALLQNIGTFFSFIFSFLFSKTL